MNLPERLRQLMEDRFNMEPEHDDGWVLHVQCLNWIDLLRQGEFGKFREREREELERYIWWASKRHSLYITGFRPFEWYKGHSEILEDEILPHACHTDALMMPRDVYKEWVKMYKEAEQEKEESLQNTPPPNNSNNTSKENKSKVVRFFDYR